MTMTRTRFLVLPTDTLNRYHAVFTVQVIFEGVIGDGYTGDIAVDDVKLGITNLCSFTPDSARQGMSGLYLLYWA